MSRDGYQTEKPTEAERRWVARLDKTKKEKGIIGGAVCVYIAAPDGECLAALPVTAASKPGALAAFLERHGKGLSLLEERAATPPEKPLPAGARRFVVRTKLVEPTNRGTSRDAVHLAEKDWCKLVPPEGKRQEVPREVAEALLRYAYPPLPAWDAKLARVEKAELIVEREGKALKLSGSVRLIYPDRGKPEDGVASAKLRGVGRLAADGSLREFVLVGTEGEYAWRWKGEAIGRRLRLAVEMDSPGRTE